GEKASSPLREIVASVNRKVIDTLLLHNANILVMGDMNDNPNNHSILKILAAKGDKTQVGITDLFNPFYHLYQQGIGTLAYRDEWNLFDQIIISHSMLNKNNNLYFYKSQICNFEFLKNTSGRFKGYPHRTYIGNVFENGYSDHFPVCIYLLKKYNSLL
ncbi:MAG: endonuclease/exonuclease/phosphatase, partial [Chitinophagaceae bacterium]